MTNDALVSEIKKIQRRNKHVEIEKAWETSNSRKTSIAIITYVFMTVFFYSIDVDKPYINSLVPTFGYLLSTLTLGALKNIWMRKKE